MSQFLKGKMQKILDARKAEFELRQRIRKEEQEKEQKRKHTNHLRKVRREEELRAREGGPLKRMLKQALITGLKETKEILTEEPKKKRG